MNEIIKVIEAKSKKVNLLNLKETITEYKVKFPEVVEKFNEENPLGDWDGHIQEVIPAFVLSQYANLFSDIPKDNPWVFLNHIPADECEIFYKNLIELFVIRKDDFDGSRNIDAFLNNFSLPIKTVNLNSEFKQLGDFNLFNAQPILRLDRDRFFIPVTYCLYEACYESPLYWMLKDKEYKDQLAEHRGKTGEDISYEFLSNVFGKERTYKSVKIITKKGHVCTDVDVLCVLGSKALCVTTV